MENREKNILDEPLVSIITPIYNCDKYIEETIRSVLCQTYQNWEMIMVDDISTDKTLEIAYSYAEKDPRIKVLKLPEKGGASIARNVAINKARGKYIAFLDGDDLWLPEKLKKQIGFMMKYGYAFSYTNYYVAKTKFVYAIDDETKLISKVCPDKVIYKDLLKKNYIGCLTVIFDAEKTGKINISKLDKRNDYALWLKILRKGFSGFLFGEPLAIYRSHIGLSNGNRIKLIKYHYQMFFKVLEYRKVTALFLTIRNLFYFFK
jgi:teichuronic acid biosynthesis glycosyltransferase TuaG